MLSLGVITFKIRIHVGREFPKQIIQNLQSGLNLLKFLRPLKIMALLTMQSTSCSAVLVCSGHLKDAKLSDNEVVGT